jgi:SAM-dependent methyltransferase
MLKLRQHSALPKPTRDQAARQDYVHDLRRNLAGVRRDFAKFYERRIEPAFIKEQGRPPRDRHEVRHAITANSTYQLWSAAQRFSQELAWESVIDTVETQGVPKLATASPLGTLALDPDLKVPHYHDAQDIHLMPGGYHGGATPDPIANGAIFDMGVRIWGTGGMGPENDILGVITSAWFAANYSNFSPRRILDMGCSIGGSTLPWKRAFPNAEVYAIDVGGPVLAYGHRRAEALGVPVHFSQQNAEKTNFESGSFDVVVSHIMLHETSGGALPRIFAECHRLLRPGGIMLHFDAGPISGTNHFQDFMNEWEVHNNNEAFLSALREIDVEALIIKAGFARENVDRIVAPGPSQEDVKSKGYVNFSGARGYRGIKQS